MSVVSVRKKLLVNVVGVIAASAAATGWCQSIKMPTTPLVIQLASSTQLTPNTHPAQFSDSKGRQVAATYDSQGRLVHLKVGPRWNISDLTVSYDAKGRVQLLTFGNAYHVSFRYMPTGTQKVMDILGNRLIRSPGSGSAYVTTSAVDQDGILTSTLAAAAALFAQIQPATGLNTAG